MCVGCRERKKKEELVRFTRGSEGILFHSDKKRLAGRGFYLCPNLKCLKMAQKKNQMGRILGSHGSPISLETVLARQLRKGGIVV
jgi:predicted RNA-binding protein YlxR (DUF448 family)